MIGNPFLRLDGPATPEASGWPWRFSARAPHSVLVDPPDPWGALAALLEALQAGPSDGVVAALLSYELAGTLETLPAPVAAGPDFPRLWAARFATAASEPGPVPAGPAPGLRFVPDLDRAAYLAQIDAVRGLIGAGDIYQANLSLRFHAQAPPAFDPLAAYGALARATAAPFAACVGLGDGRALLSASPELFLAVDGAGLVTTRPIKGTRPRGATPEKDRALAAELAASEKDRAENLMIVDLLRNDLGRVCRAVRVPRLMELTSFRTVHHLVSTVTGRLAPGRTALDLLRASFPGGSITGAPKIRAMEVIASLEPARRGPYCGTLAIFRPDGSMLASILIRTAIATPGRVTLAAGGGIVWDSDPASEWDEVQTKAAALLRALG